MFGTQKISDDDVELERMGEVKSEHTDSVSDQLDVVGFIEKI